MEGSHWDAYGLEEYMHVEHHCDSLMHHLKTLYLRIFLVRYHYTLNQAWRRPMIGRIHLVGCELSLW